MSNNRGVISRENDMNIRDKKFRLREYCISCLNGLEGWQQSLALMSLLTLVCILILNTAAMDEQIVRLLHWFGSNCDWCTSLQN